MIHIIIYLLIHIIIYLLIHIIIYLLIHIIIYLLIHIIIYLLIHIIIYLLINTLEAIIIIALPLLFIDIYVTHRRIYQHIIQYQKPSSQCTLLCFYTHCPSYASVYSELLQVSQVDTFLQQFNSRTILRFLQLFLGLAEHLYLTGNHVVFCSSTQIIYTIHVC